MDESIVRVNADADVRKQTNKQTNERTNERAGSADVPARRRVTLNHGRTDAGSDGRLDGWISCGVFGHLEHT